MEGKPLGRLSTKYLASMVSFLAGALVTTDAFRFLLAHGLGLVPLVEGRCLPGAFCCDDSRDHQKRLHEQKRPAPIARQIGHERATGFGCPRCTRFLDFATVDFFRWQDAMRGCALTRSWRHAVAASLRIGTSLGARRSTRTLDDA